MSNEEIFQTMKDLVSEQFGLAPDEVTLETSFEDDLGADSVDLVELVMAMEEEFELGNDAGGRGQGHQDRGRRGELRGRQAERITCRNAPRRAGASFWEWTICGIWRKKLNYTFRNQALLEEALNHSSYANEHHMKKHSDNERLEFLGDAVLEIVSSEYLYHLHPDWPEGELTSCGQALSASRPWLSVPGRFP